MVVRLNALQARRRNPRFSHGSMDDENDHHHRRVRGEEREAVEAGEKGQGNPSERTHVSELYHGGELECEKSKKFDGKCDLPV